VNNTTIGAVPADSGPTTFAVWAPSARSVDVHLTESGELVAMERAPDGYFIADYDCDDESKYWLVLDRANRYPDPASRSQPDGVHGPSEVVNLHRFAWSDNDFAPLALRDNVLYELHVGTFSREGTFSSAIEHLDALVTLGITAIEIMPVTQFPGTRNWGYDGVFPFAVQASYGGPRGLQNFVNECHRRGLAVVLDVVYNHLGPEGNVLPAFGPYLTDRYRTPWGQAINLDGPDSDAVRAYFVANALQWFSDFHIDGLRLDAVHEFMDRSPVPFLVDLATAAANASEALGRACWLIAESASNDPRTIVPTDAGGLGMDAQWNDDFHHSVHVALTSEQFGYYADYTGASDVARSMAEGFVYQGQRSRFRKRRHGAPSRSIDPDRFVVFDQNHDQVGNRADGARLSTLIPRDRLRLAAALLLLAPGIPLLFMGEEYGETAPFTYFVDHGDPDLLEAVRRGRTHEHDGNAGAALDPADPATFEAAVLDHSLRTEGWHREIWEHYRSLLLLRAAEPALRRSSRAQTAAEAFGPVVTLIRTHATTSIVACFNLSESPQSALLPGRDCWEELLSERAAGATGTIELPPWGFRLFRADVIDERAP
jgi:maltooligosyltrehalose trehalohydrolase